MCGNTGTSHFSCEKQSPFLLILHKALGTLKIRKAKNHLIYWSCRSYHPS